MVRGESGLSIEARRRGEDANHDPRVFRFPVDEVRAAVIEADLRRHLLLWSAVLPLCTDAGSHGDLDVEAAVALLDPTLLGTPDEVDALFQGIVGTGACSWPTAATSTCSTTARSGRPCQKRP